MAIVTGVVEAVSTRYDKYSVLVNGNWYGTKIEWATVKPNKGDSIEFDDGGKKYLKNVVIKGGAPAAPTSGSRGYSSSTLGVELGHASKLAMDVTMSLSYEPGSTEFYQYWLKQTETIYALMKNLKAKHSGERTTGRVEPAPDKAYEPDKADKAVEEIADVFD